MKTSFSQQKRLRKLQKFHSLKTKCCELAITNNKIVISNQMMPCDDEYLAQHKIAMSISQKIIVPAKFHLKYLFHPDNYLPRKYYSIEIFKA